MPHTRVHANNMDSNIHHTPHIHIHMHVNIHIHIRTHINRAPNASHSPQSNILLLVYCLFASELVVSRNSNG